MLLAAACGGGGDDKAAGPPLAVWDEHCTGCGMQWQITIQNTRSRTQLEVQIQNTGERGLLSLQFEQVVGYALDESQADSWQRIYPQARAERTTFKRLEENGRSIFEFRPLPGASLPYGLNPRQTWKGRFESKGGRLPDGTVGLILSFGPVVHELTPPGLLAKDNWITLDATRPFIGLRGEVRLTPPATLPGAARPTVTTTPVNRADCAAIRGTDYRSDTERQWFIANC